MCIFFIFNQFHFLFQRKNVNGSRVYRVPLTVVRRTKGKFQDPSCSNCGVLDVDVKGSKDDELFDGLYAVEDVTIVQAEQHNVRYRTTCHEDQIYISSF